MEIGSGNETGEWEWEGEGTGEWEWRWRRARRGGLEEGLGVEGWRRG
jgi:hypothetical protein